MHILFICTGNTCRSPMAESICRETLAQKHDISENALPEYGYNIFSAGIAALDGGRISLQAVEALRNLGYGPPCRCSTHVTPEKINAADYIFTMTGDLVETIYHDNGTDAELWDLISRNNQKAVSGLYVYVVETEQPKYEKFVGKFVIVR